MRLSARPLSRTELLLSFRAPGSDGAKLPPARSYLVKQSNRPIDSARAFSRAPALCKGACRYSVTEVGEQITLSVTNLRPNTTYYYAIAARDNVSARLGRRSPAVQVKTR